MDRYEKKARSIMKCGDEIIAERKRRKALILRSCALGAGAAAILGIGICANALKPPKKPTAESSVIITNTAEAITTSAESTVQTSVKSVTTQMQSSAATSAQTETVTAKSTDKSAETVPVKFTSAVTTAFHTAGTVWTSEKTTVNETTNTTAVTVNSTLASSISMATISEATSQSSNSKAVVITTTAFQPPNGTSTVSTRPYVYSDRSFMYVQAVGENDIYLKSGANADDNQIGEFINKRDVCEVDSAHSEDVEIYELNSIDRKCAVVIKYLSANACPIYLNTSYEPDTLGDMLSDMAITEQMTFGEDNIRSTAEKKYYTVSAEKILNILIENQSAVNTKESLNDIKRDVIIFSKLPYMKYNVSFAISKQGYITTNIIDRGASFYIGEDKALEYIEYLLSS